MIVKYVILCFHGAHARLTHLEVGGLGTAGSRYRRPIAHLIQESAGGSMEHSLAMLQMGISIG